MEPKGTLCRTAKSNLISCNNVVFLPFEHIERTEHIKQSYSRLNRSYSIPLCLCVIQYPFLPRYQSVVGGGR